MLTTVTFYPMGSGGTNWSCGYAYRLVAGGASWADIHDGAGTGVAAAGSDLRAVGISAEQASGKWYGQNRGRASFSTQDLPPGITIISARVKAWGYAKNDDLGILPAMTVVKTSGMLPVTLAKEDYNRFGSVPISNSIGYNDFVIGGDNVFYLTDSGIAFISLTAPTILGLREANYDIPNIEPAWSSLKTSRMRCLGAYADGGHALALEITYESGRPQSRAFIVG